MTQPVQEPTTQRSISQGKWGENQLFRRPSADICAPCTLDTASVRGPVSNISVTTGTFTTIPQQWTNVTNVGSQDYIRIASSGGQEIIRVVAHCIFSITVTIEWTATFTATRRLLVYPAGSLFPEGAGALQVDLGEEGNNNTWTGIYRSSGAVPFDIQFEAWQDSGVTQTITGDTSVMLVLLGLQ